MSRRIARHTVAHAFGKLRPSAGGDAPGGDDPGLDRPRAGVPDDLPRLTNEERMLVTIRDTLYEGSWDDFLNDLRDRLADRPYVFDTVPASPRTRQTIGHHIELIERLAAWERQAGRELRAD
jgi:hypothetical protein